MKKKSVRRRIALAYPLAVPHLALFTQGVSDYAREQGGWTFIASPTIGSSFPETLAMTLASLKDWRGDGVIAVVATQDQERAALKLGIPIVNLAGTLQHSRLPRVMVDHKEIGRLAAEHLLECGLRRFAYLGTKDVWYAYLRRCGFVERIAEASCSCEVLESKRRADANQLWSRATRDIDAWLRRLKPPVGIMAVHDYRARVLIDQCDHLGLDVPNNVALIGVDNDETICEFCHPPLSSVSRSGRRVGYETAKLLDNLMAGKSPPSEDILIPPDGVIRRRSTDVVAYDDPNVAVCTRFIRDHVDETFGVECLLQLVNISRRSLETHFKQCTGYTLHDTIIRQRIRRAMELLSGPKNMPLDDIATASGFPDSRALRRAFRRVTGTTPKAWSPASSYEVISNAISWNGRAMAKKTEDQKPKTKDQIRKSNIE
ncbi:MAG: substrate-binding domain-containing protein [Pirellulales bacterium]|nr:substrate-binding domain-containing protein [Pirellulales bacterium]